MTWLGDQLGRIADDMPERDLGAMAIEIHQRRRRNFMALAAAAVVVVIVLAATVGVRALPGEPRAAARPSAPPPELSAIKVGVVPTVESAPVFVALAKGYFKDEGLTVEPVIVTGAPASVPMIENRSLDLTQTDYSTAFLTHVLGRRLKIVSSLHQAAPGTFAIVVNAKSKIRTAADLKRKKILVPNLNSLDMLTSSAALERAGLTSKDVLWWEKPYPDMLSTVASGKADAAVLAEPYVTVARETGRVRILENLMTRDFAGLPSAGMVATDDWIGQNPRTLAAFNRGLAKAQQLIAGDPRQVRDVLPRYTKVSQATVANIPLGSYPARLDLAKLQRLADLAYARKWLREPPDLSAVVKGG